MDRGKGFGLPCRVFCAVIPGAAKAMIRCPICGRFNTPGGRLGAMAAGPSRGIQSMIAVMALMMGCPRPGQHRPKRTGKRAGDTMGLAQLPGWSNSPALSFAV